jgi:alanyl-tRNA synthetase
MSRSLLLYRDLMPSLASIRSTFLDHFAGAGHAVLGSSPLVPHDDPTLLFTNAGMVQFKNLFTGAETPKVPRAATSQKCVRAGGKHNDLDNVGYTARHHTFFEMLGNFSFGDYFKEDAIGLAWSLISKTFGLSADRLLVTVYADDEEAAALWRKIAGFPDEKIIRIATSDNFWSMGDTGPCGPCSEIFYDHGAHIPGGPPGSPDQDGDRWVEVWNLVFMQFEQFADGRREPLPKPSIDTGMGLERIAAVLQGVHNNYDVDLFRTLIDASEALTGVKAEGDRAPSHRVIADHLRAMSFLIADGVTPSNEGRGYVLRRIMRRAMRHAHLLGAADPLLHRLAPTLIGQMGPAFPELNRAEALILATLEQEEVRFRRTLGRGLDLLSDAAQGLQAGDALSGETAFRLYDTYGFPLDLTQDVLRARDIAVDLAGFDAAMAKQKAEARAAWAGSGAAGTDAIWFDLKERIGATEFLGYAREAGVGLLKAIVAAGAETHRLEPGAQAELIFDQSPFYAESGGQAGDTGLIRIGDALFQVTDTRKRASALHGHLGTLMSGSIAVGDEARLEVDHARRSALRANHSATHILHAALRDTLGAHVTQKGSLVEADRLRFDFSHGQAVTPDELRSIERQVNSVIRQNTAAETRLMAPEDAIAAGAMALFGEKYGEEVRVLSMGRRDADAPYSVELCGGTHVGRTGDIGAFAILSEGAVAAGVRRIEAATGDAALEHLRGLAAYGQHAAERLKTPLPELEDRVAALLDARKTLEKELAEVRKKLALAGDGGAAPAGPETVAGVAFLARKLAGVSAKDLRGLVEEARAQIGSGVVAYAADADGKLALVVGVTPDLTGSHRAGDLIRAAAQAVGGQGGGKPDMAQGGGPDPTRADDALAAVRAALEGAAAPA